MKLIIGLGNPGKEYEETRHNAGFMCVDLLASKLKSQDFKLQKKFEAEIAEADFNDEKLFLIKPQTYMNASGDCVKKLVNFYKCAPEDLFIIYDDIDLPLGAIRLRKNGSAGSHNGMKSIISILGFNNFPRLRIGIESRGISSPKEEDITSFVLHPFNKEERAIFEKTLTQAAAAISIAFLPKTY